MRFTIVLAAALVAAGCLGLDRTFPDESVEVREIHVNAYARPDPNAARDAIVEVEGRGEDGEPHAFKSTLRVHVEFQTDENGTYETVRSWEQPVAAPSFANQTAPRFVFTIPEGNLDRAGTYRVTVGAVVDGRELEGSALFAHPGRA